jgi:hypothetical protein
LSMTTGQAQHESRRAESLGIPRVNGDVGRIKMRFVRAPEAGNGGVNGDGGRTRIDWCEHRKQATSRPGGHEGSERKSGESRIAAESPTPPAPRLRAVRRDGQLPVEVARRRRGAASAGACPKDEREGEASP